MIPGSETEQYPLKAHKTEQIAGFKNVETKSDLIFNELTSTADAATAVTVKAAKAEITGPETLSFGMPVRTKSRTVLINAAAAVILIANEVLPEAQSNMTPDTAREIKKANRPLKNSIFAVICMVSAKAPLPNNTLNNGFDINEMQKPKGIDKTTVFLSRNSTSLL